MVKSRVSASGSGGSRSRSRLRSRSESRSNPSSSSSDNGADANSSNIAPRVNKQTCIEKAVHQNIRTVTSGKNSAVQMIKTGRSPVLKWNRYCWGGSWNLSEDSWQRSTGRVFHCRIAPGKKVWLYEPVSHWICTYLVSNLLVQVGTGSR